MDKLAQLRSQLASLRAGETPEVEIYTVIHGFGNERFTEAKPYIEQQLGHPDPQIRYIALNVLAIHWMCTEHRQTCEHFALTDLDSDNRRLGISGLGALLEGTRDPKVLQLLLHVFNDEQEEPHVRDRAYSSILYVLGKPAKAQPSATRRLNYAEDVNWEWIGEASDIAKTAPR